MSRIRLETAVGRSPSKSSVQTGAAASGCSPVSGEGTVDANDTGNGIDLLRTGCGQPKLNEVARLGRPRQLCVHWLVGPTIQARWFIDATEEISKAMPGRPQKRGLIDHWRPGEHSLPGRLDPLLQWTVRSDLGHLGLAPQALQISGFMLIACLGNQLGLLVVLGPFGQRLWIEQLLQREGHRMGATQKGVQIRRRMQQGLVKLTHIPSSLTANS